MVQSVLIPSLSNSNLFVNPAGVSWKVVFDIWCVDYPMEPDKKKSFWEDIVADFSFFIDLSIKY